MMKNAFCFTLKALFILKIIEFLSKIFGHLQKRFEYKVKVNEQLGNKQLQ